MSLLVQDESNILHGIKGGWTMRFEIVNGLLLGEAASSRMTMENWIGNEEEGSLIPRGKETYDRIQCHELRGNEEPTMNMVI